MSAMPWLKSYPEGMRWDVELQGTAVQDLLDNTAATWPDKPAIDYLGFKLNYRQLKTMTDRVAKGLQGLGVGPGVHVGLFLPTGLHYVLGFFGVLKAGGTLVNYSPLDAAKVLEHKVEDSQTDFIITLDNPGLYPQMDALLGKTRLKGLIIGRHSDFGIPNADAGIAATDDKHVALARLLDNDGAYTPHAIADPADSIAVLQYTGGTTGLPKGAMLTHANLTITCQQYIETSRAKPVDLVIEGEERMLVVLPMFHIYALTANMLFGIRTATELILHPRFDIQSVLKDLVEKKITVFLGVPTMFTAIISTPGVDKLDLKSLKFCSSGGAPLPVEVLNRFKALTGCPLGEGWGMTETSPAGTFGPLTVPVPPGSCGLPVPGVRLKFVSVENPDQEVALGEKGEICIAGPNVMKGYWKKDDANKASFDSEGFFRTGDVGYMNEGGWTFIVDRTKDMLLCGGYNVYPRVIEEAIYEHASVAEAMVIGIPDEYRGQSPKAYIVLKPDTALTLDELKKFLSTRLGKHEMVHALEIRKELPKTAVGKLSKLALYEELKAAEQSASVKASPT